MKNIIIPAFWNPDYDAGVKETAGLLREAHGGAMDAWIKFRETPVGADWHPWADKESTLSQLTFELGRAADAMGILAKYVDGRVGEKHMKELAEGRALRRFLFGEFPSTRERGTRVEVVL